MYDSEIDYVPYKTIFNHRNLLCTTLYRSFLQWATAMSCTFLKQKWRSKISKTTTCFCSQNFISILNLLEKPKCQICIVYTKGLKPHHGDIPPPDFLSTRIGISSSLPCFSAYQTCQLQPEIGWLAFLRSNANWRAAISWQSAELYAGWVGGAIRISLVKTRKTYQINPWIPWTQKASQLSKGENYDAITHLFRCSRCRCCGHHLSEAKNICR